MFKTLQIPEDKYETIRKNKHDIFKTTDRISYIKGADILIEKCINLGINLAIVTNSSSDFVKHLQSKLPILSKINQWITREDYKEAKPSEEAYKLALQKFYKGEKYKIGFENTINGFNSIKSSVNTIYFITNTNSYNYPKMYKEDIYLISDLTSIE
jgi:beta-phosphoglucomutase-like phosphatase (HAD superfamily)